MVASLHHLERDQRLAQARAALAKAHALTGVKTLPVNAAAPVRVRQRPGPTPPVAGLAPSASGLNSSVPGLTPPVPGAVHTSQSPSLTPSETASLRSGTPGNVWHLEGGNSQILDALTQAATPTSWIIFIALPNIGWCAAAERGLPLERTIVVTDPGAATAQVLAAAIDSFDLLACGPLALPANQQRALAARIRARRVTCFTTAAWPGASRPYQTLQRFAQKVG